jgi:membrane fusion protein (multidrug efflux system)
MATMEKKRTNTKFIIIFATLIILGGTYGGYKYFHSLTHETTDDAQIEKKINPIIPRVAGYVTDIFVADNQKVKKGDTLLKIDSRDYEIKVQEAEANVAAAEANLEVSKADIGTSNATIGASSASVQSASGNIESAKIRLNRASNDFERYNNLYKNKSITKQQFEQAEAAKLEAENQVQILKDQQRAASFQKSAASFRKSVSTKQIDVAAARVKQAQAMLNSAKINLNYTFVLATNDGQVSKINLQPGQFVQPGQSLFYLINNSETWVIANFKETQLDKMKIGQEVEIHVDAFPDTPFIGKIASFSPATGSKFSILPPDNATGNFVKTIQRLPVKITFDLEKDSEKLNLLRAGMNVDVDVHLK